MPKTGGRDDPYQHYNFRLEIDGTNSAGFMECSGMTSDTDVVDYREGYDPGLHTRKLPGLRKHTNIVLKRGYTDNMDLWQWRKNIINGIVDRRSVDIILQNEEHKDVLRWRVSEAWIAKWDSGSFNAKSNDVAIETVELVHEGIEMV